MDALNLCNTWTTAAVIPLDEVNAGCTVPTRLAAAVINVAFTEGTSEAKLAEASEFGYIIYTDTAISTWRACTLVDLCRTTRPYVAYITEHGQDSCTNTP